MTSKLARHELPADDDQIPESVLRVLDEAYQANHELGTVDEVIDYHFPGMKASGSSGLFAVKVAIDRGAQRIILAGVPMTKADGHFFNPEPWRQRSSYTQAWEDMLPMLRQYVRSMSGWTAEKLGKPSKEWISE